MTKARTTTHCASQVPIMACKRWIATEFGGPAALSLESGPLPEPGKGEVRVRLLATTATYTDLLVLRGSYIPKVRVYFRTARWQRRESSTWGTFCVCSHNHTSLVPPLWTATDLLTRASSLSL